MRKNVRTKESKPTWAQIAFRLGMGAVLAGVVILILLLAGALVIERGILPQRFGMAIGYVTCSIGCFAGGTYVGKIIGYPRIVPGMGVAAFTVMILIISGSLAYGWPIEGIKILYTTVACAAGGGASAIFKARKSSSRTKKREEHRRGHCAKGNIHSHVRAKTQ